MKKFISLLATSLVLLFATSTASAGTINGEISTFGNALTTYDSITNPTYITAVNFSPLASSTGIASVGVATGDFLTNGVSVFDLATWNFGSLVTMTDFTTPLTASITPLWTVEGFAFNLDTITTNAVNGGTASIEGNGTMSHVGYDDTFFTWVFSTQVTTGETTFSARSVPAPAGAALLGLGLLGFGFARRNKKA